MGESNAHYYATRDPLGMAGDFVTAPEISQMFGELIGLWLADLWERAGRPGGAVYAELGPGRGTLAKDALRAMAGAGLHPETHLVEGSPALRRVQAAAVPGARFHDDPSSLPAQRSLLLVANEFLDALPIRQLVRTPDGWRERMVGLRDGALAFVAGPAVLDTLLPALPADAPVDTIVEVNPGAAAVVADIGHRIAQAGGAALFVDYGHLAPRSGSTLQAVKAHCKAGALDAPGEADLSAHVDFAALAEIARNVGCRVSLTTQGDWLTTMGIDLRTAALSRIQPARAEAIAAARDRLVHPGAMGELFKVLAIVAPGWPDAAGFG
nr:SAM-dependent methyltransferase [Qipengyuania sediminis]